MAWARRTGGLLVGSGGAVEMLLKWRCVHLEPPPEEEPAGTYLQSTRPGRQLPRDENCYAFVVRILVAREVLALQVCVDRHFRSTPSSYGRDEIDSGRSTPLSYQVQSLCRYLNVHGHPLFELKV